MTATAEINLLQSLKGDTYFAQIFSEATIDAMCDNIRKDFQIDCGVDLFENCHSVLVARREAATYKGKLDERDKEVEDLREQKSDLADFLLTLEDDATFPMSKTISDKVVEMLGRKETIRRKLKLNIGLSSEDKEWLQENL